MTMKKKGLHVNSALMVNVKVTEKTIYGARHIVVEGAGSIVADSVMNDIYYPLEEVQKLANSTVGDIHAPSAHPKDDDGNFISATSTRAAHQNYVGAISTNYRMSEGGDVLLRDIAIDPEVAARTPDGLLILDRIRNKMDTDTSTGLLMQIEASPGIGKDGEPYNYIARNMTLDHDAILLNEAGAAQSAEGVGMFANSAEDTFSIDEFAVNQSAPAMRLPLAPNGYEWNEMRAIENIKQYTGSTEKPSANYRKFFMEFNQEAVDEFESYTMPFADIINGVPHAVFNAIAGSSHPVANAYAEKFSNESDDSGFLNKVANAVKHYFAREGKNEYNNHQGNSPSLINNQSGERPMLDRKATIAMLEGAGIKVNADISETDLKAELKKAIGGEGDLTANRMGDNMGKKPNMDDKKKKDMEMMNGDFGKMDQRMNMIEDGQSAMMGRLDEIMKQFKYDTNAKKEQLAKQVANLDIGLTEEAAKTMEVNALEGIVAKNAGTVQYGAAGLSVNAKSPLADMEAPE